MAHKAGFINIIGRPNVGKSTLMNQLMGEKFSIVTHKAQTTRHRIMGIINGEDFQIVYSDTPGIISPRYELQNIMMNYVLESLEDADLILFVTDIYEKHNEKEIIQMLEKTTVPIVVLINKIDTATQPDVMAKIKYWEETLSPTAVIPISALHKFNLESVMHIILEKLPEHPPYFPKDEITNRSERFFASEFIREKLFKYLEQEVPYCCQVEIISFKESQDLIRIHAEIIVERESQKGIVIGKHGDMLKKIGTEARKDMEKFFGKKIFLEQYVKVEPNWRKDKRKLRLFGYGT
ncbi:MAG: GTPase Era [Cytophagales bacterium]|nr:GTPase Era [Cytophagales bacterium]MDW8383904.1 GTPase Era [Flammeovirgaceae bacterium]